MKRYFLHSGYYFFVLCVFITAGTKAQQDNWFIEKIDWKKGFYQNTADCIIQDSLGFIFIGTSNGLYRYDGYNFKNYVPGYGFEGNLRHTRIMSLTEDTKGYIWIGTEGGLYKYNRENEKFIYYENTKEFKCIWHLYFDSQNRLWLGTNRGWFVGYFFEHEENIDFRHVPSINNGISSKALFIHETRDGLFCANTPEGLVRINTNLESENIPLFIHGKNPYNYHVYDCYETTNGDFLLGTSVGLFLLRNGDLGFGLYPVKLKLGEETFLFDEISIRQISEDNDRNLWLLTGKLGLIKFNPLRDQVNYSLLQDKQDLLFPEDNCNMFIDRSGVIWIGIARQGLFKINPNLKDFETIRNSGSYPDLLSNYYVNCFCKDSYENLWIGTMNGVNILTPKNQAMKKFIHLLNEPGKQAYFQSNNITCMVEDKEGSIWIGTTGGLTHILYQNSNFKDSKIFNFNPGLNSQMLQSPFITSLCYTSKHELWIGTRNGLSLFLPGENQGEGSFITFQHDPDDTNSLCHNEIFSICEGNDHCLWIGTNGGGINKLKFDNLNGKTKSVFTHYKSDPSSTKSLTNNYVYSVYEDQSNNLWVGVWGGGLNKMITDTSGKFMYFKHYGTEEGLPDFGVYGILEDENGYLLQDNNFRKFAYYKDKYGKMYFGGASGYTSFVPSSIDNFNSIATPVISKMYLFNSEVSTGEEINGKIILEKSISLTQQLTLDYTENSFSFEFSALTYSAPERCKFLYKLENYDSDWHEADGVRRVATYTKLPHGDYILRLKASNRDGIWNEKPFVLNIHIKPPVWLTPIAYLFYFIILALIVCMILFIKQKRDKIKKEIFINKKNREREKKLEQYKMEFYTDIVHELRTPVSLIQGPIEELIKSNNVNGHANYLYHLMNKNSQRLLALIDQLLYFRNVEMGHMKMEVAKHDFIHLIKEILEAFEPWFQKKNMQFRLSCPQGEIYTYFDQEKIFKIFSNLISNALRYNL
jgi:ligand-binding sensor domain-containing protein